MFDSVPKRVFGGGALALLVVAIMFAKTYIVVTLILLALSAVAFCLSLTAEQRAAKHSRLENRYFPVALYGLMLVISFMLYNDGADERQFKSYLSGHGCEFVETEMAGQVTGQCDNRTGQCDDGQDVEEAVYLCSATGNRITFKQFVEGVYGN